MTRRRRAIAILSFMAAAAVAAAWTFTQWRSRAGEARRLWAKGVSDADAGRYDAAKAAWSRCAVLSPQDHDCVMGMSLLARQDELQARVLETLPAPAEDDVSLAMRLVREGRVAEGVALAQVALDRSPDNRLALSILKLYAGRASAETLLAKAAPAAAADEDDKRRAVQHWNEGIKYFQKGEPAKARDEWLLCGRFDAGNSECKEGLRRLDSAYGSRP